MNWNPPIPIGQTTDDPNHKHSGHDAIMSGGANACPICQAFEIASLKSELATVRATNTALIAVARAADHAFRIGYSLANHAALAEALTALEAQGIDL